MLNAIDLHKFLIADYVTGKLQWKARTPSLFTAGKYGADRICKAWNVRYAGEPAFTAKDACGYYVGAIHNIAYKSHRVIFAMFHEVWPDGEIDHINGDPSYNSISNLRDVSCGENRMNMPLQSNNTSGHVGVGWVPHLGAWSAKIKVNYETTRLGYFRDKCDAIEARRTAEISMGFHDNHGRSSYVK